MKVLLLVSELEDYTIAFANGLAAHTEVLLCVPRRRYAGLARWLDPAVDIRLLDWPRHRSLGNLRFLLGLNRLVRRERPDVIHLLSNNVSWLNLLLPFWRRTPIVTTVHDVDVHPGDRETQTLPSWSTTLAVRQSHAVVVHGESLRRRAALRFGRRSDEIHVLDHPAIRRYAELARKEDVPSRRAGAPFTLLLFGRIFAYKGLDLLLRAEASLDAGRPLRVIIAGRGDDPWRMSHLMGDPGRYDVRNRFIEDREVAELFLEADAVVLPYVEASQSGVLSLAAAFGRPVIATDVGELGVTVGVQGMGIVVPPGDAEAFAAAIARLAGDPLAAAELGRNALRWAEGSASPEVVGGKATAMYHRILQMGEAGYAKRMRQPLGG